MDGGESGLAVSFEVGHLIRFGDGLIIEFIGFPTWEEAVAAAERPSTT